MALEVWGDKPKSQVDPSTIDEQIDSDIQDHLADPDAHLETGQSLQSHKASDIIDHLAKSIVNDKLLEVVRSWTAIVDINGSGDFIDIQSAIDYVYSLGGGRILVLPGTYVPDRVLSLKENVELVGFNLNDVIIDLSSTIINTGTVSFTEDSDIITGVGTFWLDDDIQPDDVIYIPFLDQTFYIVAVNSNTEIQVDEVACDSGSDKAYTLTIPRHISADGSARAKYNGTILVTSGSNSIVGSSTTFASGLNVGDLFFIKDVPYVIASIVDDLNLTLESNYNGRTESGLTYFAGSFIADIGFHNFSVLNSDFYSGAIVFNQVYNSQISNIISTNNTDGLSLESCDSIIVYSCRLINASGSYSRGLNSRFSSNIYVYYNDISNNGGDGIGFGDVRGGNVIENNSIVSNGNVGVGFSSMAFLGTLQNILINNDISGNGGIGVRFYDANNSIVANNTITNNNSTGIFCQICDNLSIFGNIVVSNASSGIYLIATSSFKNILVNCNQIISNGASGVYVDRIECVVSNNIITGNSYYGVRLTSNSDRNIVIGNVILRSGSGSILDDGTNNTKEHNIIS